MEHPGEVRVICDKCKGYRAVNVHALVTTKGPGYSLINRRARCRLTEGCDGWCHFYYASGVFRPLWDDRAVERWMG